MRTILKLTRKHTCSKRLGLRCAFGPCLIAMVIGLVLSLGLGLPSVSCSPPSKPVEKQKGATQMSNLNISLRIPVPETLVGENLMVEVTLENPGSDAVEVPSPDGDREFEYALRRIEPDPTQPVIVSAKMARRKKTAETVPDLPRFMARLNPKDKLVYAEDLSAYLIPAPTAGRYEITATYTKGM